MPSSTIDFRRRIVLIGCGSIGQGLLPLLLRHFAWLNPTDIQVLTSDRRGENVASLYQIPFRVDALTEKNFDSILSEFLRPADILINVAVDVSSLHLIRWCQENDVLYLDTCIEPWAGGYVDTSIPVEQRTNHWLRKQALALHCPGKTTAVIAHGANPGLVSHFVKRALTLLAEKRGVEDRSSFAGIACRLGVRAIHIAEHDSQDDGTPLGNAEFVNTWSIDGLQSEAGQLAELGWGTYEGIPPSCVNFHDEESTAGVMLDTPGAATKISSWVPSVGEQTAYLLSHHESLSIAEFLSIRDNRGNLVYRPTVLYAYRPTDKTCLSLERWVQSEYAGTMKKTLLRDEIAGGSDILGVLLVFDRTSFWFGSSLSYAQAASLAPFNNATSLQVNAAIVGALQWMIDNPAMGIVEAENMDFEEVLKTATPYLGEVSGVNSDWPADRGTRLADILVNKPRKRSGRVPLVLLGTLSLLAACDNGNFPGNGEFNEIKQNIYNTRDDCQKDWGDADRNCQSAGSSGQFIGPRYAWNHGGGYPVIIDSDGSTRMASNSAFARGVPSTAVSTMTTAVPRGGFGSTAHGFSESMGG